jgi:hypothetical protein
MEDLATDKTLFVIILLFLTVIAFPILGAGNVAGIHKGSKAGLIFSKIHNQIKGVKILRLHTAPSTVSVGSTFNIGGLVFNNSTSVITFPNGTCNSPVSIDFNKNVMIESQGIALCTTPTKDVTLKPLQSSPIVSTRNSGIAYRATSPGVTNATITFNYRVETANGKSPISDNISRIYAFNIHNMSGANFGSANGHIRGIKLLQVHTYPPLVTNGNSFVIRALVFNNSTSAVTFLNGTCNQSVHINFNKNVEDSKDSLCATTPQKSITLMPKEQSFIVSGTSYKATSLGIVNATILFNYGVQNTKDIPVYNDNTSRSFTFDIKKVSNPQGSTFHNATHFHIKGVKLLHIRTNPTKVYLGTVFSLNAMALNNSTSTISLANGTCLSPMFISFNSNVLHENQTSSNKCKVQPVLLKPGAQISVFSSNLSKPTFKATSAGVANGTITFKYKVLAPTSKSFINDSISRIFSLKIQNTPSAASLKK